MEENYNELYEKICYSFKDRTLLTMALSHPSLCYSKKYKCISYEKLELLGDSVLSLAVLDILIAAYPNFNEGELAKRKSNLVCTDALARVGREMGLGKYIYMTKGEEKMDGRNSSRVLENVIESIIGAIYVDGGLESVRPFIDRYWSEMVKEQEFIKKDPKTRLQEWLQKNKYSIPKYKTIGQSGPESNPNFEIQIFVKGLPLFSKTAKNKKEAEVACAVDMIEYIRDNLDSGI